MIARKLLTGGVAGAMTVSVIALTAGVATAAPDTDDTTFTTVATDVIGVGSDTSQAVVKKLADSYNSGKNAPTPRLATYAATNRGANNPNEIQLPTGAITRPNGSTAGKSLLYGGTGNAGNNDIDFARSSSGLSTDEQNAQLKAFPFALDTLGTATAPTTNAPASLSVAQLLEIYEGRARTWNQVGGTSTATIVPYIPQSGSGTRSFFLAQLQAAKGAAPVQLGTNVSDAFQENSDEKIKGDPNAIAPFSVGLATKVGTVRVQPGFTANRAVYNVVRNRDVADATLTGLFGSAGFLCSATAKPIIEAEGFKQLFTPSRGGACGQVTSTSTSNFTVAEVPTTTAVTVTSASASSARVVARVTGSTAPSGTVTFFEGANPVAANVPVAQGQAVATPAATPGSHTYRAVFTPAANTAFTGSEGTGTGTVSKATSSLSESFAAKAKTRTKGKKTVVKALKGSVTVTLAGSTAKGAGTILVKRGAKTVGTGSLQGGVATFSLTGLKAGTNKLTATWGGDANSAGSTVAFTVKAAKAKKK